MAVLKCKSCGGTLTMEEGAGVAVCEYCGTKQTVPKNNSEVVTRLFNRANNLRLKCEFDKAASVYEKIVQEDDSEAEAYWGLVLCKFGIEYVEDPKTHDRIPTCHRTLFESITSDVDYQAAIDYSDTLQQIIYEQEARKIDRIQKDILAIVKEEKPFDVFLCYKETDENGKRTQDSVIANDIYYQLTQEGFKVFYAAITLEDKLGQEYEPYIFAALNSAKVMLVIGTRPEYFNAVWVKNEWSRFMNFMKTDRTKLLIPCYKDMDAYDLPEEFSHLQAQDMGKIGFINDVVRGIKKVIVKEEPKEKISGTVSVQQAAGNTTAAAQVKRGNMALEDGDWQKADAFFEEALNLDPECAEAYLGLFMAEIKAKDKQAAAGQFIAGNFLNNRYWKRANQFAEGNLLEELTGWEKKREEWLAAEENQRKEAERQKKEEKEKFNREKEDFLKQYRNGTLQYPEDIQKKYDALKAEADRLAEEAELLEKESVSAPERKVLKETKERIAERKNYLSTLGIFKGKEKAAVQAEIDRLKQNETELESEIQEKERRVTQKREDVKKNRLKMKEVTRDFVRKRAIQFKIRKLQFEYGLPGDFVKFGAAFQGGQEREPMDWIILDVQDNKALLLSKYCLDSIGYNEKYESTTWEKCTLRSYLHQQFYMWSFSTEEKKLILSSDVTADKNPKFSTDPGRNTEDKIFLLSIPEVEAYFPNEKGRVCQPTTFAVTNSRRQARDGIGMLDRYCDWWLRSPGSGNDRAAYINEEGSVCERTVHGVCVGVRPAMWVRQESFASVGSEVAVEKKEHDADSVMWDAQESQAAEGSAEGVEEKTEFDVELSDVGPNAIRIIKIVREFTGLGLREAKDAVDSAPVILKKAADKAVAEDMKVKLEAAGAKITLH